MVRHHLFSESLEHLRIEVLTLNPDLGTGYKWQGLKYSWESTANVYWRTCHINVN